MKANYMDIGVLILDDDEMTRMVLTKHLETAAVFLGMNLSIYQTGNADEAWRMWKKNKVHGIVTDMVLGGGINGIQFLTEIRKDIPSGSIPAIILTGITDDFNVEKMWSFAQVVQKPMKPWFYKGCIWWLSSLHSFWRSVEIDFPEPVTQNHDQVAKILAEAKEKNNV